MSVNSNNIMQLVRNLHKRVVVKVITWLLYDINLYFPLVKTRVHTSKTFQSVCLYSVPG